MVKVSLPLEAGVLEARLLSIQSKILNKALHRDQLFDIEQWWGEGGGRSSFYACMSGTLSASAKELVASFFRLEREQNESWSE